MWPAASSTPTGDRNLDPGNSWPPSAGDNTAMESFLVLLHKNVLDRHRWTTRHGLRLTIITWTERTYHRRHSQTRLGRPTPTEYETIMTTPALQAA